MPTPRNRGSLCRHHKCHIIVLCVLLIACAIYGLSCPERTSAFRFFARNLIQLKNIIQFIYLLLKILYFYTISIFIGSLQWSDRPLALYLHFVISLKYENFEKYYQYIFHYNLNIWYPFLIVASYSVKSCEIACDSDSAWQSQRW